MKKLITILIAIFILTGCARSAAPAPSATPQIESLEVLFINVGKADSALVSFGDRHYLIDAGSAESFNKIVQALRANGIETLDGVFISHTDEDHMGGLEGLLKAFDVKTVYASNISENKKDGSNIIDGITESAGMAVSRLKAGDEVIVDPEHPQTKFSVLGPRVYFEDDNDNSLVLYLQYGAYSCLFAGDMQTEEEESLLEAGVIKECTVLKVGNHGNPDATSHELAAAASPEYAIISTDSSVDENTPAERVLSELSGAGAHVFTTQDSGTGVLATLGAGGVAVQNYTAQLPEAAQGITVESLDREAELLVLRNNSSRAADLGGWWIYSERGGEMFFFDKGVSISPGGTLSIASGKNPPDADIIWDEKNVWSDDKDDVAVIYDNFGNEVSRSSD